MVQQPSQFFSAVGTLCKKMSFALVKAAKPVSPQAARCARKRRRSNAHERFVVELHIASKAPANNDLASPDALPAADRPVFWRQNQGVAKLQYDIASALWFLKSQKTAGRSAAGSASGLANHYLQALARYVKLDHEAFMRHLTTPTFTCASCRPWGLTGFAAFTSAKLIFCKACHTR